MKIKKTRAAVTTFGKIPRGGVFTRVSSGVVYVKLWRDEPPNVANLSDGDHNNLDDCEPVYSHPNAELDLGE